MGVSFSREGRRFAAGITIDRARARASPNGSGAVPSGIPQ